MAQESTIKKIAIGVAIPVITAVILKYISQNEKPKDPPRQATTTSMPAQPGTVYVAPNRDTVFVVQEEATTGQQIDYATAAGGKGPLSQWDDDATDEAVGPGNISGTWQAINGAVYVVQDDGMGGILIQEWYSGAVTASGYGTRSGSMVNFNFENLIGITGSGVITIAPDGSFLDVSFTDPVTGLPQSNRLFR